MERPQQRGRHTDGSFSHHFENNAGLQDRCKSHRKTRESSAWSRYGFIASAMTASPHEQRLHPRVDVDVMGAFKQRGRVGSWEILDVSQGGFCATGDLGGLDIDLPVHVRIGAGEGAVHGLAVLTWTRPLGDEAWPVHGWAFASMTELARMDLAALIRRPPRRSYEPPPLPPPRDETAPVRRIAYGILALTVAALVGAWIATL